MIDLGRIVPGRQDVKVYSRVIMTPLHAKQLLEALAQNISIFEQKFGEIRVDGASGVLDRTSRRTASRSAAATHAHQDHRRRPGRLRMRVRPRAPRTSRRSASRCGRRRSTAAHQTSNLAELVCSNSFRSSAITNAVGLLKREMALLDSLVIRCGKEARVPAGDAFAVDRDRFSAAVTNAIAAEPNITLRRDEVTSLDRGDYDFLVVATGPLTSQPLFDAINDFLGRDGLYFYDAIAPILAADSLDMSKLYWKSRYGKGAGTDYLNAPMTQEQYEAFVAALLDRRALSRRTTSRKPRTSRAACRSRRSPRAASRRFASVR